MLGDNTQERKAETIGNKKVQRDENRRQYRRGKAETIGNKKVQRRRIGSSTEEGRQGPEAEGLAKGFCKGVAADGRMRTGGGVRSES